MPGTHQVLQRVCKLQMWESFSPTSSNSPKPPFNVKAKCSKWIAISVLGLGQNLPNSAYAGFSRSPTLCHVQKNSGQFCIKVPLHSFLLVFSVAGSKGSAGLKRRSLLMRLFNVAGSLYDCSQFALSFFFQKLKVKKESLPNRSPWFSWQAFDMHFTKGLARRHLTALQERSRSHKTKWNHQITFESALGKIQQTFFFQTAMKWCHKNCFYS